MQFRCKCLNVTIHLSSPPTALAELPEELQWVEDETNMLSTARAELSVAGERVMWGELVKRRTASSGWNVLRCYNCGVDVIAYESSRKNEVIVNMAMVEGESQQNLEDTENYSSVFRVMLYHCDDVATPKDSLQTDSETSVLKMLQVRVTEEIAKERTAMEERCAAFIKAEKEAFAQFEAKAHQDRTILWRRITGLVQDQSARPQEAPRTMLRGSAPRLARASKSRSSNAHLKPIVLTPESPRRTLAKSHAETRQPPGSDTASPDEARESVDTAHLPDAKINGDTKDVLAVVDTKVVEADGKTRESQTPTTTPATEPTLFEMEEDSVFDSTAKQAAWEPPEDDEPSSDKEEGEDNRRRLVFQQRPVEMASSVPMSIPLAASQMIAKQERGDPKFVAPHQLASTYHAAMVGLPLPSTPLQPSSRSYVQRMK